MLQLLPPVKDVNSIDSCSKLLTAVIYLTENVALYCKLMHFLTYFLQAQIIRWCPKIDNYEVCFEPLSQIQTNALLE